MTFEQNIRKLAGVSHLAALALFDGDTPCGRVENAPGQRGSLAIYNHLAQTWGAITPAAARQGLALYAEHTEQARGEPGKHPHIDRLFDIIEQNRSLQIKQVFAVQDAGCSGQKGLNHTAQKRGLVEGGGDQGGEAKGD